jgi:hypothetical protein
MQKSIRFYFFATREDALPGILAFEAAYRVQYVLEDFADTPTIVRYSSITEIPDLGQSLHGATVCDRSYLILPADVEVKIKPVPQRRGGIKYSIGLLLNPTGFAFTPGGVYGERVLIAGSVGTATGHPDSIKLCKAFIRKLRRGWTKVYYCYVGPHALQLMKEGWRLTMNIQSPGEYDLSLPSDTDS